mmetsp:Transcript_31650/g.94011  ORF Transcript_31650/g.94011 Transcript_31650/m.94011 type:complete len:251 (+) Transcript_31650:198-950(+)
MPLTNEPRPPCGPSPPGGPPELEEDPLASLANCSASLSTAVSEPEPARSTRAALFSSSWCSWPCSFQTASWATAAWARPESALSSSTSAACCTATARDMTPLCFSCSCFCWAEDPQPVLDAEGVLVAAVPLTGCDMAFAAPSSGADSASLSSLTPPLARARYCAFRPLNFAVARSSLFCASSALSEPSPQSLATFLAANVATSILFLAFATSCLVTSAAVNRAIPGGGAAAAGAAAAGAAAAGTAACAAA